MSILYRSVQHSPLCGEYGAGKDSREPVVLNRPGTSEYYCMVILVVDIIPARDQLNRQNYFFSG